MGDEILRSLTPGLFALSAVLLNGDFGASGVVGVLFFLPRAYAFAASLNRDATPSRFSLSPFEEDGEGIWFCGLVTLV